MGFSLLVHLLFSLYFMRVLWISLPKKGKIMTLFVGVYVLFRTVFLANRYPFSVPPSLFGIPLVGFEIPILSGVSWLWTVLDFVLYSYLFCFTYLYLGGRIYRIIDPINPTSRILMATKLWRIILILFGVYSVLNGTITLYHTLSEVVDLPFFGGFLFYGPIVVSLVFLVSLGLLAYIALFYPEGLIISEAHLMRAKDAYQKIQERLTTDQGATLDLNAIEEYLSQIPPEVFDRIPTKVDTKSL